MSIESSTTHIFKSIIPMGILIYRNYWYKINQFYIAYYIFGFLKVRMRPPYAQWRYKLDVLVDGRPIYFDRYPQKIQHFPGVTVYTPSNILNQSHVVMMFQSGAGVEVLENKHYMACRVYLPWEFINQTRGQLKFMFSKKATKYCKIFTVDLPLTK